MLKLHYRLSYVTDKKLPNFKNFAGKILLGIDFGTKISGLATFKVGSDPYPTPYKGVKYLNDNDLVLKIFQVIQDESIDVVVLGLPLFSDGSESEMTKKVKGFGKLLQNKISPLKVYFQDETLSTFEAKDRMRKSPQYNFTVDLSKIDALSASIILEDFMAQTRQLAST